MCHSASTVVIFQKIAARRTYKYDNTQEATRICSTGEGDQGLQEVLGGGYEQESAQRIATHLPISQFSTTSKSNIFVNAPITIYQPMAFPLPQLTTIPTL